MKARRSIKSIAAAFAAACALSLSACGGSGDGGDGDGKIKVGQWVAGTISTTALTSKMLADNTELEKKHGVDVEFVEYTNLQALYTDIATGRIDAIVGGPESFAASASKGAPLAVAGTFSRSNAAIFSAGDELTADTLRGKRLVAATQTSTWSLVRNQIQELTGLDAEKDYTLVTAESSNASLQQLGAGTADFAMAWGEALLEGPVQFPNIKNVADAEKLAGGKEPFVQFVIAVNSDKVDKDTAGKLVETYADQTAWMAEHADEVDAEAVEAGRKAGVSKQMVTDGLMNFDVKPLSQKEVDELTALMQAAVDDGRLSQLPPESFFIVK